MTSISERRIDHVPLKTNLCVIINRHPERAGIAVQCYWNSNTVWSRRDHTYKVSHERHLVSLNKFCLNRVANRCKWHSNWPHWRTRPLKIKNTTPLGIKAGNGSLQQITKL